MKKKNHKETISDIIAEGFEIARNMQQPCEQEEKKFILDGTKRLKAAYQNEFEIIKKVCDTLIQCELFFGYICKHAQPTLNPGDKCIACKDREKMRTMVNKSLKLLEKSGFITYD